jgi:hypothetical protein
MHTHRENTKSPLTWSKHITPEVSYLSVKDKTKALKNALVQDRRAADAAFKQREEAIQALAEKAAQDEIAVAEAEKQDALRRNNFNLAQLLNSSQVAQRVPTVEERHAWCAEYGASLQAIALAAATTCEPWLSNYDDVFMPALVTDDDGTQRRVHCNERLVQALGALQHLHDMKVRVAEEAAQQERKRLADQRALALAEMSDEEFSRMLETQRRMEK